MKMKIYKLTIIAVLTVISTAAAAQAPRSAYHLDGFLYGYQLNPAFHTDSNYISLPVLGGTSVQMSSTMKLGNLFYDGPQGSIYTFLSPEAISKADLMKKVGSAWKQNLDTRLTLISIGRRLNESRYQIFDVNLRMQENIRIDKSLFDVMKDVENREYKVQNTDIAAHGTLEFAYGESRKIDDKLTVGAKGKLLLGLMSLDAKVNSLTIGLEQTEWTTQGCATLNASGLNFTKTMKNYSVKEGQYEMVDGLKSASVGIHGIGAAVDLGAEYKYDDQWTFSASLLDLGFITWFDNKRAENSGEKFVFSGFKDVSGVRDGENALIKQWDNLCDQFMDMVHLQDKGSKAYTQMLGATIEAGASYRYGMFKAGALLTSRLQKYHSWVEGRLSLSATPLPDLDVAVSPAYSTYSASVGAVVSYHPGNYHFYLASDNLFLTINRQGIPTSLNAAVQFGVALPL